MSATNRNRATTRAVVLFTILLLLIVGSLGLLLFVLPPREGESPELSGADESPIAEEIPEEREPPADDTEEVTPDQTATPAPKAEYKIYLVVDDAGHSLADVKPYLDLPFPVTFAILPERKASRQTATAISHSGKESILHLPMEPLGEANPGGGAILTTQESEEIAALLRRHLSATPGVIGVNNHMGSKATADPRVMRAVLSTLSAEGLFFLDSRTTAESVAADLANELGVPFAERTVFLDNSRSDDAVTTQFREAAAIAVREGYAVAIGHVTSPVVAKIAALHEAEFLEKGIAFAPLSELFYSR